jgi:dipeptidyl aminopeptidase/acylaminoacyl peptidase
LLAWLWGWQDEANVVPKSEFWVLPWPTGQPYQVLPNVGRAAPATATFDWLPDSRRILVALWDDAKTSTHLSIADTTNGSIMPLTTTPGSEGRPDVAPDGRRVAFTSEAIDFDLVEIPLDGAPLSPLLATSRNELDPTFARDGSQYAYVSDRNGLLQIWLRSRDGQWERSVVSGDQFQGATLMLGSPALSPDGQRIAYQRYGNRGYQIWISTVAAAGPPVLLAPGALYQDAPTWSPDGVWVAFLQRTKDFLAVLAKARVGAAGTPEVLLERVPLGSRPSWSPDGRWIVTDTVDGLTLVSADGGPPRVVSEDSWIAYTWAADSRHLYGLREADRARHFALGVLDIVTGAERVINEDLGLIPPASQPIRGLTVVGPGALATSLASARSDVWLLEGFDVARSLLDRLWRR